MKWSKEKVIGWAALGAGIAGIAGAAWYVSAPLVALQRATDRATACVARFQAPRGPAFPSCGATIHDFEKLAGTWYTHHDATYRAEELWSRIMVGLYENAAIGDPDARELARTSAFVADAQAVVERGSRRISFDDLGPSMGAPNLGESAAQLGDRRTLVSQYESWSLWSVRVRAEEAALAEGDLEKAVQIANRYAKDEPREADLRTTTAAILCAGPDPSTGLALFASVPIDRSEKRHAAMARNYGEVLGAIEACAGRAKVPAPPAPAGSSAGSADLEETRAVEEILVEKDPKLLGFALDRAAGLLGEAAGISDANEPYARAFLLAALVARDSDAPRESSEAPRFDPIVLDDFVKRRSNEGPLAPEPHHVLDETLGEALGLHPVLPAEMLARASEELERVADEPDPLPKPVAKPKADEKPEPKAKAERAKTEHGAKPGLTNDDDSLVRFVKDAEEPSRKPEPPRPPPPFAERRAHLRSAAGALALDAGIAAARLGEARLASKEMARAVVLLDLDAATSNLLSATVEYVAGDPAVAAATLAGPPAADARIAMESSLVRALALASSGDRDAAKQSLEAALSLADKAKDARLLVDARWLAMALLPQTKPDGAPTQPVCTGQADISHRWETRDDLCAAPAEGAPRAIERDLAAWSAALAGRPEDRLAFRYGLMRVAGDAPESMTAYLTAGARLLDEGKSGDDVEVWLDALTADDRPRMTASAYAFHRREAARIRGDQASAKVWDERLHKIRALKADPATMALAAFLDG